MNRPYVICHMTVSLDGKVTGNFLADPACAPATALYYQIHRERKADGFACGRVTMEGSFTGGWYPDLSTYAPAPGWRWKMDYIPENLSSFYAVAFDPHGRLGWKTARIIDPDGDPGYHRAQIIEVLTGDIDPRYTGYLEEKGIAYIFAGETQIDLEVALMKLRNFFGIQMLLLEGGSILNGGFQRAGLIDELSLVVAPVVADAQDKPLFTDSTMDTYRLVGAENPAGICWLKFKR